MKKILLLFCLFTSYTLYAQRFNGGALFGLNASQVDGDTYAGYNKFGIALGAYVYTPLSKTVDIQLELKYMGKGANKKTTDADPYKYTNQLDYIEIPVILRFKTSSRIDLEGGLGYGYLFNNSIKDAYGTTSSDELFKTSDWLGIAGIKYAATDILSITMRFSYSFFNIRKGLSGSTNFRNGGAFNNLLSIGLTYELRFKQKP
jgi:hypothetical protein